MQKRGQISLFLIVGIIIFVIIVFLVFLNIKIKSGLKEEVSKESVYSVDVKEIDDYVRECIKENIGEALNKLYDYGGYIDINSVTYKENGDVCLVYMDGDYKSYLPKEDIDNDGISTFEEYLEKEINDYVTEKLPSCINNLRSSSDYNIKDFSSDIKAKIEIPPITYLKEEIKVEIEYPIEIEKETKSRISEFKVDFPSGLREIKNVVQNKITSKEIGELNLGSGGFSNYCFPISEISEGLVKVKCEFSGTNKRYLVSYTLEKNPKEFRFLICKS